MLAPRVRGVISLGTNTARLLVVRDDGDGHIEQLEHRAIGTRLGEGLRDGGMLGEPAMARTLAAVAEFTGCAHALGAELGSIATSAVRRAQNRDEFADRMRALTGVALQVIDGDAEAAASYAGATYGDADNGKAVAVVDIGGGSTECAVGRAGRLEHAVSCEIGSVRLSERFPPMSGSQPGETAVRAAAEARDVAGTALAPLAGFAGIDEVRAVAGTATTIAAIAFEDRVENVRGRILTATIVGAVLDRMLSLDLAGRRALPGMLAQRADILPAGAIVLLESMARLRVDRATVETNDLLLGFLLQSM